MIDPQLDTDTYLQLANDKGCRITAIVETHRNEDFISGAVALSKRVHAPVYHGPDADEPIAYAETVNDGDTFHVGAWKLRILTTPGHTKDSICIAITDTDSSDDVIGVFTGDTLFVSDVGRADFYPDEKKAMASNLYHSLQKIIGLGEHVIVYPAHGAGSVCGGGMAEREFTTLGMEHRSNPLLQLDSEEEFVARKVNEHHYIAPYFSEMEAANVKGVDAAIPAQLCSPLNASQRETWLTTDGRPGMLVDLRHHAAFREHHVPASLNLPGGLLSAYGGWLLAYDTPIAFVADNAAQANEGAAQLWRMGFRQIEGYLTSLPVPVSAEEKRTQSVATITADKVAERLENPDKNWVLLDVRKRDEVETMPFTGALHTYLGHLKGYAKKVNTQTHYTCMCGSGARATVAASYLQMLGCRQVDVFEGSLKAWKSANR